MITVEGDEIRVETRTLSAAIRRGWLSSLVNRATGEQLIRPFDTAEEAALQLVYRGGEAVRVDGHMQGKNVRGAAGYVGPKPPAGQTHPYHFEVFALNTTLNLDPENADRNAVVNAMKSHVLTKGDLVAMYTGK